MKVTLNNTQNFKSKLPQILRKQTVQTPNGIGYYLKVNPAFSINNIEAAIMNKAEYLPDNIATFILDLLNYSKKNIDIQNLTQTYFRRLHTFYKRINFVSDSKLFRETYSPEIDTIKKAAGAIQAFSQHDISKRTFDANIEQYLLDYSNKPINKTAFFLG